MQSIEAPSESKMFDCFTGSECQTEKDENQTDEEQIHETENQQPQSIANNTNTPDTLSLQKSEISF